MVAGVMVTEPTAGSVLPTLTDVASVSVPPSASVAVAVQLMLSAGELVDAESVSEAPVPRLVPSVALAQA